VGAAAGPVRDPLHRQPRTYLLQAGDAQQPDLLDLDKLDQNLMYGQILTLAQTIQALDATPAAAL
jgi:hypothetical protein